MKRDRICYEEDLLLYEESVKGVSVDGGDMDRQERMDELRARALTCPGCPNLRTRHKVVFGEGDVHADVMFVGQGPGMVEEATGRPFVGPAGELLDRALQEIGIPRERLWITNIIKCRAVKQEKGRLVDRAPLAGEIKACRPWLEGELAIVQPSIVVCVGTPAAHALIDKKFKLSEQHGQFHQDPSGTRFLAVFHPAYVLRLRSVDPEAHARTWGALSRDLQKVATAWREMK